MIHHLPTTEFNNFYYFCNCFLSLDEFERGICLKLSSKFYFRFKSIKYLFLSNISSFYSIIVDISFCYFILFIAYWFRLASHHARSEIEWNSRR